MEGKRGTMISLENAVEILEKYTRELKIEESVTLECALFRYAAMDLCAGISQPPFPKSPLDGYAVRAEDTTEASVENPVYFTVTDKIYAGQESEDTVGPMETVRLMTGAPIPAGADAVIRQEEVEEAEGKAVLRKRMSPYENYCHAGEDFKKGECLIQEGERLDAVRIGLAASMGFGKIPVKKMPRTAVISTGSELEEPGEKLRPGKIYDSNLYTIGARIRELGVSEISLRRAEDEEKSIDEVLKDELKHSDLIITTGGVSVGEKDLMPEILEKMGAFILFHGVSVKPGSPVLAAYLQGKIILCLSGNPFGALVHLELLARPVLAKMTGIPELKVSEKTGTMVSEFDKKSDERRMIRAVYQDGKVTLPCGLHASGVLSSMKGCSCLIDIKAGSKGLKKGDVVCLKML